MSARETVGRLVAELGQRLGLAMQLDERGCCALLYGADHPLDIWVPEPGSVLVLFTRLTAAPATGREAFFAGLLALNAHGIETDGCLIGLDEATDRIVLSLNRPVAGLDALGLENVMGKFVETAERLRPRIAGSVIAAQQSRQSAAPSSMELWQNLHLRA